MSHAKINLKICLYPVLGNPAGVCGKPVSGRGYHRFCPIHSHIARNELRQDRNLEYVHKHRTRKLWTRTLVDNILDNLKWSDEQVATDDRYKDYVQLPKVSLNSLRGAFTRRLQDISRWFWGISLNSKGGQRFISSGQLQDGRYAYIIFESDYPGNNFSNELQIALLARLNNVAIIRSDGLVRNTNDAYVVIFAIAVSTGEIPFLNASHQIPEGSPILDLVNQFCITLATMANDSSDFLVFPLPHLLGDNRLTFIFFLYPKRCCLQSLLGVKISHVYPKKDGIPYYRLEDGEIGLYLYS